MRVDTLHLSLPDHNSGMHFVSATSINSLAAVKIAEKYGEYYISAHKDGSIVLCNAEGDIQKVWLNPGQPVRAVTVFDDTMLVAYDDNCARVFSIDTGMLLKELTLPFNCHKFAVFEHLIVCVPRNHTEISIIHRESLEIIKSIDTASFIVDILSLQDKLLVVCSAHIYVLNVSLKSYTLSLSLVFSPSFTIVAAAVYNGLLVLVNPSEWRLLRISNTCEFHEDFSIPAPETPIAAKQIGIGILVQCNKNKYVFLRDNNLQVVSSPFINEEGIEHITSYGLIGESPEEYYSYELANNELSFVKRTTKLEFSSRGFLMGQTDSSVTATMGEYTGNENGEINGIKILPSEILSIDGKMAHSKHGSVQLPLSPLNVVYKDPYGFSPNVHGKDEAHGSKAYLNDSRISIRVEINPKITTKSTDWVGITYRNYVCLQLNDATQPQIAVLHILSNILDSKTAAESIRNCENSLFDLENLVISSCEGKRDTPLLYATAGKLLAEIWTQERVLQLMQYNGHRSIKLLAAMSNFCRIDTTAVQKMVEASARKTSVQDCMAVLWVFINAPDVVKKLRIPFGCFQFIPEPVIAKFSHEIAENDGEKLLNSAESVLDSGKTVNDSVSVIFAIKLLLAAVTTSKFPASEPQLVRLVKLVMPTINSRIPGAKQILTRLVATNQVYYHQGRQKLLIPTPHTPGEVALVVDVTNEEQQVLKSVENNNDSNDNNNNKKNGSSHYQDIQPVFSGDGKMVMAVVGQKRYCWPLTRALSFFRTNEEIQPVEMA